MIHLGHVCEIRRYPVKSMAGIASESASMGWHGLEGDRRFAFRRINANNGFPWLSASQLAELLLYQPVPDVNRRGVLPTHVQAPSGALLELGSAELNKEISRRFGSDVELMHLKHGIFDEAPISVISTATIATIGREAGDGSGRALDARRFRMNIVVDTADQKGFAEDGWIGQTLMFGNPNLSSDAIGAFDQRPAVSVIMPDERCAMVNLDPETGASDARVMKTVVRLNQNNAGVYATVIRTGTVRVGDAVILV